LPDVVSWIVPFLFVLTLVVTIHELGHYWAARGPSAPVIDSFSVGFGRAIFKWRDKRGVEWRIGWIPLGGYVRFAGDDNAASVPDQDDLAEMKARILEHNDPAALQKFFHFKPVWQRAMITVAGPGGQFRPGDRPVRVAARRLRRGAQHAAGDRSRAGQRGREGRISTPATSFTPAMDGQVVHDFQDIVRTVRRAPNVPIVFTVERSGRELQLVTATPALKEVVDPTGAARRSACSA
jgi:regulator of sigma E protease